MRPYSRGTPPINFSLRVSCQLGQQFSLGENFTPQDFQIDNIKCKATVENGCLLIIASDFPTHNSAEIFFHKLQHKIAFVALQERIDISIPQHLTTPTKAHWNFIPNDSTCINHGWPSDSINPLLIPNLGACIYPEHEYVAISESILLTPKFIHSLSSILEKLSNPAEILLSPEPIDEILLIAIANYTHASRSTQWVWSFLLTVMTLEMLAIQITSKNNNKKNHQSPHWI